MATINATGFETALKGFDRMAQRGMTRRIVEAGAGVLDRMMREATEMRQHVRTGDMLAAIGPSDYKEGLGWGEQSVYPQGMDREGERNATKMYVINYGRGKKKRRGKMGDQFITGIEPEMETAAQEAMQAESDALIEEING